ncbi:DUF5110 domain-containing protein [Puniceicoccales bacterium CK1056]|uniref:DUF5110 domain-containing protein n=1 Tax=Oceanipulchritudo coccoides TaxID=2706888 RepID=A0A6B2M321_9BACT|nr:DUF5110 domain-containing protein [Oceanipulchritudo coccoides]
MVGEGIAWFLPEGVDEGNLPSLALEALPVEIGPLPDDWSLVPSFSSVDGNFQTILNLPPGTDLYGTGEVTGPLRRNDTVITLWNTDNWGYHRDDGKRLYQSHPWVMGMREDGSSFGVIFDSTWRASLETHDTKIVFTSEGPPFQVLVIDQDSPQAVMESLASLTGHMPLPPPWALGYHQCKYSYFPDQRVREIADEFRERELPCDVIWMDIDYMDGFRIFTFDESRFPDPAGTNGYLHEKGFKSIWMIDPGVKAEPGYSVFDTGTAADVWVRGTEGTEPFIGEVWPGPCVFPDFTIPSARDWWAGLYTDFLATGIDGVWNDMNEPAVFDGPDGTMPVDALHRGGDALPPGPHLRYHNVYGMLMVRASFEGILAARPQKRPFVLSRANFLGGHRYAATWTGDNRAIWEHLKMSVPMSLNLGLSGQPFNGPDIGGFSGGPDPVLYGHWIALGAFYPFSRAHADNHSPGNEPWMFGSDIERVAQTALFRRYRLLPYIYTAMEEASRTGMPVMQPLFFADPSDPHLRDEQEAFLFGEDLLVVPLWAKSPDLPEGNWRVIQLLDGDRERDAYQPVVRIRPGAIVPLGPVVQSTEGYAPDSLTLVVSLDESGRADGTLYEDDGDGFAYREGVFLRSIFEAQTNGDTVTVKLGFRHGALPDSSREVWVRLITDKGVYSASGNPTEGINIPLSQP